MSNEFPELVTAQSLETRMGSPVFIQFFDDDNSGKASPGPLNLMLDIGNADAVGQLLNKGYTLDQLWEVCDSPMLVNCATEICMGYAGERRPEWLDNDGNGRFETIRKRAYARLVDIAKAVIRVPTAEARGEGTTHAGGKLSRYTPPNRSLVFSVTERDKANGSPGSGGF